MKESPGFNIENSRRRTQNTEGMSYQRPTGEKFPEQKGREALAQMWLSDQYSE